MPSKTTAKRRPARKPRAKRAPAVEVLMQPPVCRRCGADLSTAEITGTRKQPDLIRTVDGRVWRGLKRQYRRCICGQVNAVTSPMEVEDLENS